MFQKRDKNTPLTVYERKKAMMTNRILCLGVIGLLVYWLVKALIENEDVPIWFIIMMPVLVIATAIVLIWNFRSVKELNKEIAEEEQNKKDEEEEASEDKESYAKYLREKYDIDIEEKESSTVNDDDQ